MGAGRWLHRLGAGVVLAALMPAHLVGPTLIGPALVGPTLGLEPRYGLLGVDVYENTVAPDRGSFGLKVVHVIPGSAAQAAGIADGDVILEIDGLRLITGKQLFCHVQSRGPGARVELRLMGRALGGRADGAGDLRLTAVLSSWPADDPAPVRDCSAMH